MQAPIGLLGLEAVEPVIHELGPRGAGPVTGAAETDASLGCLVHHEAKHSCRSGAPCPGCLIQGCVFTSQEDVPLNLGRNSAPAPISDGAAEYGHQNGRPSPQGRSSSQTDSLAHLGPCQTGGTIHGDVAGSPLPVGITLPQCPGIPDHRQGRREPDQVELEHVRSGMHALIRLISDEITGDAADDHDPIIMLKIRGQLLVHHKTLDIRMRREVLVNQAGRQAAAILNGH